MWLTSNWCEQWGAFYWQKYILLHVKHLFRGLLKDLVGSETIKLHRIQVSRQTEFAKHPVVINIYQGMKASTLGKK